MQHDVIFVCQYSNFAYFYCMKKQFCLLCCVVSLNLFSQPVYFPYWDEVNSIFEVTDSMNFEDPSTFTFSYSDSFWQIANPNKLVFNASWSGTNALLTDSVLSYPINTDASFVIHVKPWTTMNFFISFNHRLDLDVGDSAHIEFSIDSIEWVNYCDLGVIFKTYYKTDLNTQQSEEAIFGENPVFTDTTTSWQQISFWLMYNFPVKNIFTEDLFIRFRLNSDSIPSSHDGWMIDDVYMGWFMFGSGIDESVQCNHVFIYPNPIVDVLHFTWEDCVFPVSIHCFDMVGKKIFEVKSSDYSIQIPTILPGLYTFLFYDAQGKYSTSVIQITQ